MPGRICRDGRPTDHAWKALRRCNTGTRRTAQRRERLKAPEDPHSWHTPQAIAEARTTLHALDAAATPRERQILSLLAKGYSDDEVATALRCQPSVVYTNRYRLQKKLPH